MMYLLKFTGEMEPQNVKLEYHNVCSALMPFLLTEHFHILSQQYVISDSCPVLKVETNLNKAVKETWLLLLCHIIKISLDSILKTNFYALGLGLRYKKIISFVICVISSRCFLISLHVHPLTSTMDTEVQSEHDLTILVLAVIVPFTSGTG